MVVGPMSALSQSWVLEGKSKSGVSENQWLASFNFPVFGSLRQSPRNAVRPAQLADRLITLHIIDEILNVDLYG